MVKIGYNKEAFKNYNNIREILKQEDIYFTNTSYIFKVIDERKYSNSILLLAHDMVVDPDGTTFNYLAERYPIQGDAEYFEGIRIYQFNTDSIIQKEMIDYDFENHSQYHKSIVKSNNAHSGSKVSRIDGQNEYSAGYNESVENIIQSQAKIVDITIWIYYDDPEAKAKLVCSFENDSATIQWKATDIENIVKPGE